MKRLLLFAVVTLFCSTAHSQTIVTSGNPKTGQTQVSPTFFNRGIKLPVRDTGDYAAWEKLNGMLTLQPGTLDGYKYNVAAGKWQAFGAGGGGGVGVPYNLTADTLLSKFSTAGNVRVTQDGAKVRADLNVRLDTAGGLVTVTGLNSFVYNKNEVDAKLAALEALLTPGGTADLARIVGRTSLIDWFSADYGLHDSVTTKVSRLTGRKGNVLNVPNSDPAYRVNYSATGGPLGKPAFTFGEPKVLAGDLAIPQTKDIVVWAVLKSTGSNSTNAFNLEGAFDGELAMRTRFGTTATAYQHGSGGYQEADAAMANGTWNIVRVRAYRSSNPADQQLKIEVNGVEGTIGYTQPNADFFSTVMNLRFGAFSPGGNYGFDGQIADLLIFSAEETPAEKAFLYNFLKNKHGL